MQHAKVAELADAPDLGSGGETHGGSTPPFRTKYLQGFAFSAVNLCAQICPPALIRAHQKC